MENPSFIDEALSCHERFSGGPPPRKKLKINHPTPPPPPPPRERSRGKEEKKRKTEVVEDFFAVPTFGMLPGSGIAGDAGKRSPPRRGEGTGSCRPSSRGGHHHGVRSFAAGLAVSRRKPARGNRFAS